MKDHLDTSKSVIISAPAGSGKTQRLAERYISLLKDGAQVEKILAITFTEKAASEMKDRIISILVRDDPETFAMLKDRIPLMRIMTIHAFCRKLITRFSIDLGIDPSLGVLDEPTAGRLWSEAVYDALRSESDGPSLFAGYLRTRGIKGWNVLVAALDAIHSRRPYSELAADSDSTGMSDEEQTLMAIYKKCLAAYWAKKRELRAIDFNDMESLAHKAISENPQWLNILYAFDEHTDHILVDEFQDTNSIQWKIIDRLTEEWRAGIGAKRSEGKTPTVFLVGDEKQSIYMFRGANVALFSRVRGMFREWMGCEVANIDLKENYRSLPEIVSFANELFSRIMPGSLAEPWRTGYSHFSPVRLGRGCVECLLVDYEVSAKQTRAREASAVARMAASFAGTLELLAHGDAARCRYSDMAVLLRNRTHLSSFENAFRRMQIPYVVVGGVGFYEEPEVAVLREFVSFLADPLDDYSLFVLLRSPLFDLPEQLIYTALQSGPPLSDRIRESPDKRLRNASDLLGRYLLRSAEGGMAGLLEDFLTETGGWSVFWEPQRHANIRKFLRITEDLQSGGMSLFELKENFILSRRSSEAKATVDTDQMDAVRIMTVHGAKGLQFPVVFLPFLDDAAPSRSGAVFVDDAGDDRFRFAYEEDRSKRDRNIFFRLRKEKEIEEEKRLFYVAVTRAMDRLILSGAVRKDGKDCVKIQGKLGYIEDAFPGSLTSGTDYSGIFSIRRDADETASGAGPGVRMECDSGAFFKGLVYTEPVRISQDSLRWINVTEDVEIRSRHGRDWVALGIIFHRLFEELSKGIVDCQALPDRVEKLLRNDPSAERDFERYRKTILDDFAKMAAAGLVDSIILPSADSYSELPFVLQKENMVYKGRIDRVIIKDGTAHVYDYKTFPAGEDEIEMLKEKYRFQMSLYAEACEGLFGLRTETFIVFTHTPLVVEL